MPLRLTRGHLKIAAVLVVVAGIVAAWRLGLFARLSDPAHAAREFAALGAWGQVAFVVAYALLQPFGVPGTLFVLVAPLIWPWPLAFVLSMLGTMAASVIGFSLARFLFRDWVTPRIPARIRAYDEALARRGFATVVTLRFILWMPPMLHAFFGVSQVPFWTHFWGSAVGYTVPLLATAYFGDRVFKLLGQVPLWGWSVAGSVAVVSVLTFWLWRRPRRRPVSH